MAKTLTRLGILQRIRPVMRRYLDRPIRTARDFDPDIVLVIKRRNAERTGDRSPSRGDTAGTLRDLHVGFLVQEEQHSCGNVPPVRPGLQFRSRHCRRIDGLIHIPCSVRPSFVGRWWHPRRTRGRLLFIGTARMRRMKILADAARQLEASGKRHFFYLYAPSIPHYILFSIHRMVTGYRGILSRRAMPLSRIS